MNGALDRVKQVEAKVAKQAAEITDLRRSVEALNVLVANRASRVVDRSARMSV